MCGIFGLIGTPWRAGAAAALGALGTRGPDETVLQDIGDATFGHTRLAVIDVEGGHQPMSSPDGRYTVVFNGEIYNFQELRDALQRRGYRFATRSDTEVLVHGYAEWGEQITPRLDGMFAFVVWDTREQALYAARDRMGIKPFFYSTAAGFAFASTLKAFLRLTGFPRRLNYEALRDYLAFQTVLAPHSFLADVRQLPPASALRWRSSTGQLHTWRYWDIPRPTAAAPDQDQLLARVDAALAESVRRQMVADVPLGAFLSGGIDSSLIVHYMAQAGAHPLKTFSMRFRQAEFDEATYAETVAHHYGTEHHVLDAPTITGEDFVSAINELDQPLADPAYVTTHALARLTRQHVTVALSGDGGDELFGGYHRFRFGEADFPRRFGQDTLRRLVEAGWLPGAFLRRTLHGRERLLYRHVELGPWPVSRKSMRRYLTHDAYARCVPERTLELWRGLSLSFGGLMDTDSLMRADLWTYLSENCLVKTDRASMAHGLEVRVPLLGNAVLDAVLPLPSRVHFAGGDKTLLRQLALRYLPDAVWRRPKHGFSVPLRALFADQWRAVSEYAVRHSDQVAPYVRPAAVRQLWQAGLSGRSSRRLTYTLIVLLIWLSHNRI